MITAERKPLDEILELVGDKKKVLVAGCDTCVAICLTGGEKEAEILASELRIKAEQEGREVEVEHTAAIRQCEWEYLDMIADKVEQADVVLSMACGIGIQSLAEKFAPQLVMPAVNTNMLGMPQEHAVWLERCVACGECRHRRDRRHLPGGALQQEPHERPLRRLARRPAAKSPARRRKTSTAPGALIWERLKAQGREELMFTTGRRRTGTRAAPAARGRWCVRRRSRYDRD